MQHHRKMQWMGTSVYYLVLGPARSRKPVANQQAQKMQSEQFEENRWEYYRERGELGYDPALTAALSRSGFAVLEASDLEKKSGSSSSQKKKEWKSKMYDAGRNPSQGPAETKLHMNR